MSPSEYRRAREAMSKMESRRARDAVSEVESQESRDTADSAKRQRKGHGEKQIEIDGQRILVADLGWSDIHSRCDVPEVISWETLAQTQQEQHAGVVLITGAPKYDTGNEPVAVVFQRLFPEWQDWRILTNGSALVVLWNPKYWHAEGMQQADLTKSPVQRAALCLKLQRVTTRSYADEDYFLVILTKFHLGTAASGHQFDAHDRTAAWESMLKIVSRESASKWLITGSLATHDVQLAVNIKEAKRGLNPTRVFSRDKIIACVAQGIDVASCHNHDQDQILVVELDAISSESIPAQVEIISSESDAEEDNTKVQLTTFYDCVMKAMPIMKDDGVKNLVPLLYGPQLPFRWAADGSLMLPAPTQEQCERKLDFALKLIHEARYQAQKDGALTARPQPGADHRKLSESQMTVALKWLKDMSE